MTSQFENQVNNSADAPQPYGGSEGSQTTGRFTQGQQQGQEKWSTDASAGGGGGERQFVTPNTSYNTNPPDTFQKRDDPVGYRVGDQAEGQFSGAASGPTGGRRPTQSSMQQTQTPSTFEKVPGAASWDSQRASTGTGAQYDQSDSKLQSGTDTQGGGTGQAGTTERAEGGGRTDSETAGTTAQGTKPKGLMTFASGVHGAGEALRGKVMQGFDEVFGYDEGAEKNRGIAQAGIEKMKSGLGKGGTASGAGGQGGSQRSGPGRNGENQETGHQSGEAGLRETRY